MVFDADPNFTHKFPVLWLVVCFRILSLSPRGWTLWIQHAKATRLSCWTLVSDVSSSFPLSRDRPWIHIWDSCHITMSLAWTAIRTDAWSFVRIQDHRRRFHCYLKTFFPIFSAKFDLKSQCWDLPSGLSWTLQRCVGDLLCRGDATMH